MKKVLGVIMSLFLVASLGAQEKEAKRIFFNYENGGTWRSTTGDTVNGVAAAAASLDTIYISAMSNSKMPNQILVSVDVDTSNFTPNGADSLLVHVNQGLGDDFEVTNATQRFVNDHFFEIRLDEGQQPATHYRLIFDGTPGANTDSISYVVRVFGIYNEN